MSILSDLQHQQRLRTAEGYLDLIMVFADRWPLSHDVRDRLARRALDELSGIDFAEVPAGQVCFLQGQALRAMDNFAEAVDPLKAARKWDPENIYIHLALGWCYKRIGRLDLAIQALEDALAVNPDEAIIHYNLACYWALAQNANLAIKYLHQSFEIDPNYREMIAEERDFDPIRDDPNFQSMIRVIV